MPLPNIPTGIEEIANAALDALAAQMPQVQADYFSAHGKYWQGILTHDVIPSNGQGSPPDTSKHPHDQDESWLDVGIVLPPAPIIAYEVHISQLYDEWNYYVIGWIEIAGNLYRKVHGAEWYQVTYKE